MTTRIYVKLERCRYEPFVGLSAKEFTSLILKISHHSTSNREELASVLLLSTPQEEFIWSGIICGF